MPNQSNACDFATSVEAAAAQLPVVPRITAFHDSNGFYIRYAMPNRMAVELETASTESEALARFIEAATDASSVNSTSLEADTLRPSDTTEYLAPLDESANIVLTKSDPAGCRVFALAGWRTDDADSQRPRWAVCQPCPREQWHYLERGEQIIYTELYTFPEGWDEDEPGATALVTHIGEMLVHDAQRGLFYATAWNVGENMMHLAADDVQEVWRVLRVIPTA